MNISAVITVDKGDVHAKVKGQRIKLKAIDIKAKIAPIGAFPDQNSSLNL